MEKGYEGKTRDSRGSVQCVDPEVLAGVRWWGAAMMYCAPQGVWTATSVVLALVLLVSAAPPSNDECAAAADLGVVTVAGGDYAFAWDWANATASSETLCHAGPVVSGDTWAFFTAQDSGLIDVNLCGSACRDVHVSVYAGDTTTVCGGAAPSHQHECGTISGCSNGCNGNARFTATSGGVYLLRLWSAAAVPTTMDMLSVEIRYYTRPVHDSCSTAIEAPLDTPILIDTRYADTTRQLCQFEADAVTGTRDVWFYTTYPALTRMDIEMCGGSSDFDTAFTLYYYPHDTVCSGLSLEHRCQDNGCGSDPDAVFLCTQLSGCPGVIRVHGAGNEFGTSSLLLRTTPQVAAAFQPSGGVGLFSDASAYDTNTVPNSNTWLVVEAGTVMTVDVAEARVRGLYIKADATVHVPAGNKLIIYSLFAHPDHAVPCRVIIEGTIEFFSQDTRMGTTCDVILRNGNLRFSGPQNVINGTTPHIGWPGALIIDGAGNNTISSKTTPTRILVSAVSWTAGNLVVDGSLHIHGFQVVDKQYVYERLQVPEPPAQVSNFTRSPGDVSPRLWTTLDDATYRYLHVYSSGKLRIDWHGDFLLGDAGSGACIDALIHDGYIEVASGTSLICTSGTAVLQGRDLSTYQNDAPAALRLEHGSSAVFADLALIYAGVEGAGQLDVGSASSTSGFAYMHAGASSAATAPGSRRLLVQSSAGDNFHPASYRFNLGGTTQGVTYSHLDVAYPADIAGRAVTVVIDPGFTPAVGSVYTVMTASNSTISGTFNTGVNGTLNSECAAVTPVYHSLPGMPAKHHAVAVRVNSVQCCGVGTCGACLDRSDCTWCPELGGCIALDDGDATCFDTSLQCVAPFLGVAQAVALLVLLLSFGLAGYVYLRSRFTSRRQASKKTELSNILDE